MLHNRHDTLISHEKRTKLYLTHHSNKFSPFTAHPSHTTTKGFAPPLTPHAITHGILTWEHILHFAPPRERHRRPQRGAFPSTEYVSLILFPFVRGRTTDLGSDSDSDLLLLLSCLCLHISYVSLRTALTLLDTRVNRSPSLVFSRHSRLVNATATSRFSRLRTALRRRVRWSRSRRRRRWAG